MKILIKKIRNSLPGWGGGAYVKLRPFWGFKILNFNIFGVFQENEYFLGYEEFVDVFAGSTQN